MPVELERKLRAEAAKKGLSGRRLSAYVYGNKVMQDYMKNDRPKKSYSKK